MIQTSISRRPAACGGFTLMEILLAILILAIVITTVLASFNTVFSTTDALEQGHERFQEARNCLQRLSTDLACLYVLRRPLFKTPEFNAPPDPFRLVGTTETLNGISFAVLRFTSRAHLPMGGDQRAGLAEIVYYPVTDEAGNVSLKRADNSYPFPDFEPRDSDPVICERVTLFALLYVDAEGETYEDWNSDSEDKGFATPRAIQVHLVTGEGAEAFHFSTRIRLSVFRKESD
jgi:general secretion pathway protein J